MMNTRTQAEMTQDCEDGVVLMPSGFWGIVGDDSQEDDSWGVYATREQALQMRQVLERSDWDANLVPANLRFTRIHQERMEHCRPQ